MTDSDAALVQRIEQRLRTYKLSVHAAENAMMIHDIEAMLPLCRDGVRWRHAVEDMGQDHNVTSDVNIDDSAKYSEV